MPVIQVQLFEGRTEDIKREYAKAITEAAVKIMGCSADSVDVIYQDIKNSIFAKFPRIILYPTLKLLNRIPATHKTLVFYTTHRRNIWLI